MPTEVAPLTRRSRDVTQTCAPGITVVFKTPHNKFLHDEKFKLTGANRSASCGCRALVLWATRGVNSAVAGGVLLVHRRGRAL